MTGTLKSLFAVAENYPSLQTNESFEELLEQLFETEDKIAYYRQMYNDIVFTYNNKCQMFPSNMIASFFKFEEAEYFEIDETGEIVPQVEF